MTKPAESSKEKIHLTMAAVLKDIAAISKDRKNEQQGFKFRGIDDIYNALHPIFAAHGLVCVPLVTSIQLPEVIKNAKGNNVYRSIVTAGYRFVASDGSSIEAQTFGEGMDFADKATAKAMSAAQKYLLIQTFLIPTVEVADGDYDTTIDPHEELRNMNEVEKARLEVERQERALAEKRAALQDKVDKEGPLPGSKPVESAPAPKATRKKAAAPVEPPATEAPEEQPEEDRAEQAAQEEEQQEPEAPPVTKPAKATKSAPVALPAWHIHVIKAITHKNFEGRTVGDLNLEELERLNVNWCEREDFKAKIEADPAKKELKKHLQDALEARRRE